jgi:hypothetical protein
MDNDADILTEQAVMCLYAPPPITYEELVRDYGNMTGLGYYAPYYSTFNNYNNLLEETLKKYFTTWSSFTINDLLKEKEILVQYYEELIKNTLDALKEIDKKYYRENRVIQGPYVNSITHYPPPPSPPSVSLPAIKNINTFLFKIVNGFDSGLQISMQLLPNPWGSTYRQPSGLWRIGGINNYRHESSSRIITAPQNIKCAIDLVDKKIELIRSRQQEREILTESAEKSIMNQEEALSKEREKAEDRLIKENKILDAALETFEKQEEKPTIDNMSDKKYDDALEEFERAEAKGGKSRKYKKKGRKSRSKRNRTTRKHHK